MAIAQLSSVGGSWAVVLFAGSLKGLHHCIAVMSIYLPNVYRTAFSLDSVVDESVAQTAAEAYVARTGETIYVPGLGEIAPSAPEPPDTTSGGGGEDVIKTVKSTKKK